MTRDEAMDAAVTQAEAFREVQRHGCSVAEFIEDLGDHATYLGSDVLGWIGY